MLTIVGDIKIKAVKSPMRLLFGAAESPARPSTSRSVIRDDEVDRLRSIDCVFEVINLPAPANKRGSVFLWFFFHRFDKGIIINYLTLGSKHVRQTHNIIFIVLKQFKLCLLHLNLFGVILLC